MTEDQDTRLSTQIVSTQIVSTSAFRSTPISGDIADEDTSKAYRNQHAFDITITISREDGEWWHKNYEPAAYPSGGPWEAIRRVDAAIRAALEGER